jgi:FAD binding domain of DNA photolyase
VASVAHRDYAWLVSVDQDRWLKCLPPWDAQVDGDLAINSMMWQNAGKSGLDQWNFTLQPTSKGQVSMLPAQLKGHRRIHRLIGTRRAVHFAVACSPRRRSPHTSQQGTVNLRTLSTVNHTTEQDPKGAFTREWVPELKELPTKYIHAPWTAPEATLQQAGVALGQTYPHRIITTDMKVYASTMHHHWSHRTQHTCGDLGGDASGQNKCELTTV